MRKLLGVASAIAVLGLAATDSQAGPKDEAAALAERGRLLYDSGQYAEALKRYRAAYTLWANPAYLFNQGTAAAALGECTIALEAYKHYITSPDSKENLVTVAREQIAQLEKQCGKAAGGSANSGDGNTGGGGDSGGGDDGGDGGSGPPGDNGTGGGDGGGTGGTSNNNGGGGLGVEKTSAPPSNARWRIATYVGAGVTVVLGAYWAYEASRLGVLGGQGSYERAVQDANANASPPLTGGNICEMSAVEDDTEYVLVKKACDDGKAAARRANITSIAALGTLGATAVFAYLGFFRPEPKADESPAISLVPAGPGDIGMSATIRF